MFLKLLKHVGFGVSFGRFTFTRDETTSQDCASESLSF